MSRHLKNIIIDRLKSTIATFVQLPMGSTPHSKGVRYFRANTGIDMFWGAMDMVKEGQTRKKRIIVRPSRFRDGLFELYTYHFPKHWSAACVENREIIKEAQRQAHALEKDCTAEGLEWRIRFLMHYFRVFKGGGKPEEGFKAYSRFYQYTYVAIYRQLKAAAQKAKDEETVDIEEISFEPIDFRPRLQAFSSPLRRAYNRYRETEETRDRIPHQRTKPTGIECPGNGHTPP